MVMCYCGGEMAMTSLSFVEKIHDLIAFVVGNWRNVKLDYITLSYRVPGYSKWCMLVNDGDLDNMAIIVYQMNIDRVDVQVDDVESDDDLVDMQDNIILNGNLALQVLVRL